MDGAPTQPATRRLTVGRGARTGSHPTGLDVRRVTPRGAGSTIRPVRRTFVNLLAAVALLAGLAAAAPAGAIVGGHPADPARWPGLVAVYDARDRTPWDGQFCAGTLVAPTKVVSAAHCVVDSGSGKRSIDPAHIRVRAGDWRLEGTRGTEAGVAALAPAPDVVDGNPDLLVITLDRPLPGPVAPVPSDGAWLLRAGAPVWAAGWGEEGEEGDYPRSPLEVRLTAVSPGSCRTLLSVPDTFAPGFDVCAGDVTAGGADTCQGDSGGPLMARAADGRRVLVAVVSRGVGCGRPYLPGVYTRLDRMADWLAAQGVPLQASGGQVAAAGRAPRIRVLERTLHVGQRLRVTYRVDDDGGRTQEEFVWLHQDEPYDFEATQMSGSRPGVEYWLEGDRIGPEMAGRTLVVCGTSVDPQGNASARSCARVRIRR